MVLLIDILHPAHVHFFAPIRAELLNRNHRVVITARHKDITTRLLTALDIPFTTLSRQRSGLGLLGEMITRTTKLIRFCRKHKPDLLLGIMGPSIALTGRLLKIPSWVFYDTENAWITNWFAYPLASRVYTPECYQGRTRKNQIRYPGYHELSYLHPHRFTPDPSILKTCGIDPKKSIIAVRFVRWAASHDIGEKGLTDEQKRAIVSTAQTYGTVYVSAESALPADLKDRILPCPVEQVHHVLAFAKLLVGESATMASEACVLGTQSIFISDTGRGYTTEQEKRYGLVKCFKRDQLGDALSFMKHYLSDSAAQRKTKDAHRQLLFEKIDVSGYVVDQIDTFFKSNHADSSSGES